jgi:hypothetical protein
MSAELNIYKMFRNRFFWLQEILSHFLLIIPHTVYVTYNVWADRPWDYGSAVLSPVRSKFHFVFPLILNNQSYLRSTLKNSLRNASCCVLVLYMSFIFLSNTTIYHLTQSHFTVHNWVYWSYNATTCFGSRSQ